MSGRIRTIKPELLEDERTSALTHEAWRAFVSLILVADDYGNFRAHPKQLEGVIFWAREVVGGISRAIRELVESGLLEVYEVNGQQYGHITGWSKHQRVDKPGKPRCPRPEHGKNVALEEDSRLSRESVESESRTTTESFLPDLRPPTSDPDQDREPPGPVVHREPVSQPDPVDGQRRAIPESEFAMNGRAYRSAYESAVVAVTGKPWGFPGKQTNGLRTVIQAHCDRRGDIQGWLERVVADFVQATRDESKFYSGWGPDGLLKWLNEPKPVVESERAQAPPSPPLVELTPEARAANAKHLANIIGSLGQHA